VEHLVAKGEKVGLAEAQRSVQALPARAPSSRRCPLSHATTRSRCSTARRNRARSGDPLYVERRHGVRARSARHGGDEARSCVSSAGATACRRRSSRRRCSRPCSTSSASRRAQAQPLHGRHPSTTCRTRSLSHDKSFDIESDDVVARDLLGPGRRRHGRRQQELASRSSAKAPSSSRRVTSCTTRSKSGSTTISLPALRAAPDPLELPRDERELRRLPHVRLPRALRRARGRRTGCDGAAQHLHAAGRGVGHAAARRAGGPHSPSAASST
jgi:hypothetical protein